MDELRSLEERLKLIQDYCPDKEIDLGIEYANELFSAGKVNKANEKFLSLGKKASEIDEYLAQFKAIEIYYHVILLNHESGLPVPDSALKRYFALVKAAECSRTDSEGRELAELLGKDEFLEEMDRIDYGRLKESDSPSDAWKAAGLAERFNHPEEAILLYIKSEYIDANREAFRVAAEKNLVDWMLTRLIENKDKHVFDLIRDAKKQCEEQGDKEMQKKLSAYFINAYESRAEAEQ
jgi:hypothetical protein